MDWKEQGRKRLCPHVSIIPRRLQVWTEEKYEKFQFVVASYSIDIWTQDSPNRREECYWLDVEARRIRETVR